jgi:hypothetical protein
MELCVDLERQFLCHRATPCSLFIDDDFMMTFSAQSVKLELTQAEF